MTIVHGCPTCATTAGVMGCPVHNGNASPYVTPQPSPGRIVTSRQYPMECVSCHGSGHSERPEFGTTGYEKCKGCDGSGRVWVTETTSASV